jgi:hypothetical protein
VVNTLAEKNAETGQAFVPPELFNPKTGRSVTEDAKGLANHTENALN